MASVLEEVLSVLGSIDALFPMLSPDIPHAELSHLLLMQRCLQRTSDALSALLEHTL
jgi:hypothetical protein